MFCDKNIKDPIKTQEETQNSWRNSKLKVKKVLSVQKSLSCYCHYIKNKKLLNVLKWLNMLKWLNLLQVFNVPKLLNLLKYLAEMTTIVPR